MKRHKPSAVIKVVLKVSISTSVYCSFREITSRYSIDRNKIRGGMYEAWRCVKVQVRVNNSFPGTLTLMDMMRMEM